MKKEQKDQLKSMSIKELQRKLVELEKDRMNLETYMLSRTGTSSKTRNYPIKKGEWGNKGNIKEIKKNIARVKTWLNVKLKEVKIK